MARTGRPRFQPTDKDRQQVETMSGLGITEENIAKVMRIDPVTLRKYFRPQLDLGMIKANLQISKALFEVATVDKNVAALIFLGKTRLGLREVSRTEHTGKDGAALPSIDPASLTDAQLESFATRLAIAFGIVETDGGGSARTRETPQSRDGQIH
jgi:hypothetical protein